MRCLMIAQCPQPGRCGHHSHVQLVCSSDGVRKPLAAAFALFTRSRSVYCCSLPWSHEQYPPNSVDSTRWIPSAARCTISECTSIQLHIGIELTPGAQVRTQSKGVADERSNITEQPPVDVLYSFLFFFVLCYQWRGERSDGWSHYLRLIPKENQRITCTATLQLLAT